MLTLLAVACGAPPGPKGWAGARPLRLDGRDVILVPRRARVYALPSNSSNVLWQFPPAQKESYPVSTETRSLLLDAVDAASLDDAAKATLRTKVGDLKVSGPSNNDLKSAVDASSASSDDKNRLKSLVSDRVGFEKDALSRLQAIYGDVGVSADAKTVYVATFRGIVFALDTATGETRWVRNAGAEIVGGIAVEGDTLYFGTKGNRLYALNAATAERQWSFETRGPVWATPTVSGDTLYATSLDGSVYAIERASGTQKWLFRGAGSGIAARPVVAGGSVYVGAFDNRLYAIGADSGEQRWSITADNWFWAAPVVREGRVYAASLDGKVYAVDAASGDAVWPSPFDAGSAIRSEPVIAGGGLVVAARNGETYKLDLQSGEPTEGSPVNTGATILADLSSVDDRTVYIVPDSASLLVLDASGALGRPGGFPLPQ